MKFTVLGVGKGAGNIVEGWIMSSLIVGFRLDGLNALVGLDKMAFDGLLLEEQYLEALEYVKPGQLAQSPALMAASQVDLTGKLVAAWR